MPKWANKVILFVRNLSVEAPVCEGTYVGRYLSVEVPVCEGTYVGRRLCVKAP